MYISINKNKTTTQKGRKTMTEKEKLLDRMIKIYGFEHEIVIQFAKIIKIPSFDTKILEELVKSHEAYPQIEDEED